MRKAVLIAIMLTVARPAFADNDEYRAMAGTGLVLTIGGAIAVPVSWYFFARGITESFACWGDCTPQQVAQHNAESDRDGNIFKWTMIGGLSALAVGIPLLCVGVHQLRKNGDSLFSAWVVPANGGAMAGITVRAF